jgi:tellurite resistance protein
VRTRDVSGTGIAIGTGASAVVQQGVRVPELESLFATVLARVEQRPADDEVDNEELARTVTLVREEAARGEEADVGKLRHWLRTLRAVAPDVLEITAAALLNPVAGVAAAVRALAAGMSGGEPPAAE